MSATSLPRHPTTAHWTFPDRRPPLPAPLERVNLRELEARPGRFEHHLMVVAEIGAARLEVATASEPLYFAHANISDEYALAMPTGDAMVEMIRMRTFISDPATGRDLGRINHRAGHLVLHPYGFLHWPGRLRPPYAPMEFAPGMRRTGYSIVFCASAPTPPGPRPLFVSAGLEAAAKQYTDAAVPFVVADLGAESARTVAVVGDVSLALAVQPERIAPPRGGYAVILDAAGDASPGDLIYIPEGAALSAEGVERALVMSSASAAPEPPPRCWQETPPAPFAPYEEASPGALPVAIRGLSVAEISAETARVTVGGGVAEVPRYWLARMLFRIALHGYRIGYVETYGGFYFEDRAGRYRLGVRGGGEVSLGADEVGRAVEALYRAVAPPGYVERLGAT